MDGLLGFGGDGVVRLALRLEVGLLRRLQDRGGVARPREQLQALRFRDLAGGVGLPETPVVRVGLVVRVALDAKWVLGVPPGAEGGGDGSARHLLDHGGQRLDLRGELVDDGVAGVRVGGGEHVRAAEVRGGVGGGVHVFERVLELGPDFAEVFAPFLLGGVDALEAVHE